MQAPGAPVQVPGGVWRTVAGRELHVSPDTARAVRAQLSCAAPECAHPTTWTAALLATPEVMVVRAQLDWAGGAGE